MPLQLHQGGFDLHAKNNRNNSDFQIRHFLVGSCHTPDGAYSLLCDLKEKQEMMLSQNVVNELRAKAKVAKAKHAIEISIYEWEKLEAQADLAEVEGGAVLHDRLVKTAKEELSYIVGLMEQLEPHRKFAHLPTSEAHQAKEKEEWKLELIHRAENFILTQGTIPHDHFAHMRMHPEYKEIVCAIDELQAKIEGAKSRSEVLLNLYNKKLLLAESKT